jgi:hypothetical protein
MLHRRLHWAVVSRRHVTERRRDTHARALPAAEFRRPGGQVVVASAGLAAAICTARASP